MYRLSTWGVHNVSFPLIHVIVYYIVQGWVKRDFAERWRFAQAELEMIWGWVKP
jgi:hypothetical protein